jgi:hypothetical protein
MDASTIATVGVRLSTSAFKLDLVAVGCERGCSAEGVGSHCHDESWAIKATQRNLLFEEGFSWVRASFGSTALE